MVKLNLGAGDVAIDGFAPIDRKSGKEVYPLDCPDGSVDEIRASHVLEHFGHREVLDVLRHWVAKLKIGGTIKIAVPDFDIIAKRKLGGEKLNVVGYLMGGQVDNDDYHRSLFDKESLAMLMESAGLSDVAEWKDEVKDCASLPISLNLAGTKKKNSKPPTQKITAIMSMPRVGFTDNFASVFKALSPLGIHVQMGQGVFWGQILTRMMEKDIAEGAEWILTIDYDTWFMNAHVIRLCQLMAEYPDADAIIPVQMKREGDLPMFGVVDSQGRPKTIVTEEDAAKPLLQVATGHFGLTLFRVSAFHKLKKPWFWSVPDPNGSWHEGRQDEDIYFWNNFRASGCEAFIASKVMIGHLQLICTFPGEAKDNWKPIHVFTGDLNKDKVPAHCIPQVEFLK